MDEEIFQWLLLYWLRKRRLNRRRYWVHKIYQWRSKNGEYHHLIEQVLSDEEKCLSYIRMRPSTFHLLLNKVSLYLEKRTTNFRKPLSPKERLIITLRYLASGENHASLSFHFRAGVSTIWGIIKETCQVLWTELQKEVMPIPDKQQWLKIAADFDTRFNFPHCLGAIDGKHIRIKKPNNSGSKFYNYKGFFSIVLLAVTDASGKFIIVDVGSCGGNSDGGVFSCSTFGKRLLKSKLDLPGESVIPGTNITIPYVFVADDAFPLRENIMKPFSHRQLTLEKEIFNYRLSRARNSVECSFGKRAQMLRILFRQIQEQLKSATDVIKAITVLHNFILIQEPQRSTVTNRTDPVVTEPDTPTLGTTLQSTRSRASKNAMRVREKNMSYFNSTEGKLPWQNDTDRCFGDNQN